MRDINKVILLGRLGANPTLRHTKAGTPVAHFSLATSRRIYNESTPQLPKATSATSPTDSSPTHHPDSASSDSLNSDSSSPTHTSIPVLADESTNPLNAEVRNPSPKRNPFEEETQWHQVVCWGKQANAAVQYLKRGHAVYIEGNIKTRPYSTQSGEARLSVEIHTETISFLGKARLEENSPEP